MVVFNKEALKRIRTNQNQVKEHTILIVDDEAVNLRILSRLLEREYNILTACDGLEALNLLENYQKREEIHLIISDQRMPKMTGVELLEKTISFMPQCRRIILTGFSDMEAIVDAINRGEICKFIHKPFDRHNLIVTVQLALEAYDMEIKTQVLNKKLETANTRLEEKVEKRTEELSLKGEELSSLVHILCHDLANPIGCAGSFISLLEKVPSDLPKYLPIIKLALKNGMEVISSVRSMQVLEKKGLIMDIKHHCLRELVEESLLILKHRFEEKNIQVQVDIDPQLIVSVEKISFINSVMNNLLTNAVKFSFSDNQVLLTSQVQADKVRLKIRDYGVGMSSALLSNLFNFNEPTSRTGTNGETGTGFGMPLVKKFMEAFGGEIQIESIQKQVGCQDHGTEISLLLPC